ncbi:MAG: DUF447 domain-containing protein [Nitrososphaerales archaeon]
MLPSGDLSDLGFVRNGIVETIVSTFDEEHTPHAAPMGVYTEDMRSIILKPYKTSQTYENLLKWRGGVANITSDPTLFYGTVFKDANPGGKVPEEWFTHAQTIDAPRMRNVDACIEFRVVGVEYSGDQAKIPCRVEKILITYRPVLRVYSRAVPAVIESLIHATRIETYLASGEEKKAEELIGLVRHYRRIVKRVAPNSTYSKIMDDIRRRIDGWRRRG